MTNVDPAVERDLIAAAQGGDTRSFEALVRAHANAVYGHALRFFGNPTAAEDASQEVFVKVYRALDTFDGRSSFSTWLYRVTRNVCLDMLRTGKRQPVPVDPFEITPPVQSDFSSLVVTNEALEHAMRALAPEDREALHAIALFELSYAEAAQALSVPVGTVKSRVFRARRTLLTLLGGGGA